MYGISSETGFSSLKDVWTAAGSIFKWNKSSINPVMSKNFNRDTVYSAEDWS